MSTTARGFLNFLRDYEAEMQKYTDAPTIFHRATATGILGALLTTHRNRCHLYGGVEFHWTNLWVVLVGDTGRSRKTTCVTMGLNVLNRTEDGADLRAPDDGSPEGFAKDLLQREGLQNGNAANVMMAGEMHSFLQTLMKEYMRNAKAMLMEWFDVPSQYRRVLSKEEFTIPYPRISIVGAIALELLPASTSSEDWLGGLMNRCLLIHGEPGPLKREPITPNKDAFEKLAKQADATLKVWRQTRINAQKRMKKDAFLFTYDKAALKLKQTFEDSTTSLLDGQKQHLLSRSDLIFKKLCAIEQVSMDPTSEVITKKAVEAASVLWQHWRTSAPGLMEVAFARSNADLEGDRLARRMLRTLKGAPDGLSERALMEVTILDVRKFTEAFAALEMAGLAIREQGEDGTVTMRAV